jgi:hypothetical protein
MIKTKIQKNKCHFYKSKSKGIALLFSVLLSSIILTIALGISSIAFKEIQFGTSAKNTNEAFFAADVGAECALYNDRTDSNVFVETSPDPIQCQSGTVTVLSAVYPIWSFVITGIGSQGQACAKVTVDKSTSTTTITSDGYNVGDASCDYLNLSRIERRLEITK